MIIFNIELLKIQLRDVWLSMVTARLKRMLLSVIN